MIEKTKHDVKLISVRVAIMMALFVLASFSGCSASSRATHNVKKEADNFNVYRKITVYNARTDTIVLECSGFMSLSNNSSNELQVTLKTGEDEYRIDYIYLCDWVIYTVEDLSGAEVSPYHYELNFRPEYLQLLEITNDEPGSDAHESDE